jgi:superfamily II DNA/RNA helicase
VFVRTRRGADRLVKRLKARDVEAAGMHGDKTQSQRKKALRRFHDGASRVLVATDVAARGLDVDDITHVVNFDAPPDRESYLHRAGRTGRAGRAGRTGASITFVTGRAGAGHGPPRERARAARRVRRAAPCVAWPPRRQEVAAPRTVRADVPGCAGARRE